MFASIAGMALSTAADAAPGCKTVMSSIEYFAKGGKLNHTKFGFHPLPPGLDCDRVACPGRVRFSIVIDTEGRPYDPVVLGNTFQIRPKEHAEEARKQVLEWRYAPPRIKGHGVCVKHMVDIVYDLKDAQRPIQ